MSVLNDLFSITPTGMLVNALGESLGPTALSASDQYDNIEAINRYITTTARLNGQATKLFDEWVQWYAGLSWYNKNFEESVEVDAFNKRNAFMRANTATAEERARVDEFLKKTPAVNVVTGDPTNVTSTGDRAKAPEPLIPTQYKVVAIATSAGVATLVLLKKLHIL